MERQIVIYKQDIGTVTADGINKHILARRGNERVFLVYQVQIDMMGTDVHSVAPETTVHIVPEITALLPHVVI
jgi:hypothetical protein